MHLNNVASPQVQFLAVIEQCLRELATVSVSAGQGHVDKGQLLGLQTLRFSQAQLGEGGGHAHAQTIKQAFNVLYNP